VTTSAAARKKLPQSPGVPRNLNAPAARAQNLSLVLHTIQRQQPISRIRLARATGISTTTITNLTAQLLDSAVVLESGVDEGATTPGAGRPPVALRMARASRVAVGVHIGVRSVRIGLIDLQGNLLTLRSIPHPPALHPSPLHEGEGAARAREMAHRIADEILALLCEEGEHLRHGRLAGIGVGASGLVESGTGVNLLAPRLGWQNVPLRELLLERLAEGAREVPEQNLGAGQRAGIGNVVAQGKVVVDNNVRSMALAESLYGVCRTVRALAFVYARVGVGAGLVVDRELYRGSGFGAGEIGHWCMVPRGGELCGCGNRGCLETLISEPALLAEAEAIQPGLTLGKANPLQTVFAAARDGHLALVEMLEDRAYYVGLALANLVNVLNPQAILLGGWLSDAFDLIEPVVSGVMQRHAFADMGRDVELLPTSFGAQSGVIGAGVLALEHFVFSPGAWLGE